jgi:cytoplasmic iron level regulating protein YaaA (DUF328/UPF0246 family)
VAQWTKLIFKKKRNLPLFLLFFLQTKQRNYKLLADWAERTRVAMAKAAIVDQVNHTHLALDFDFERPSAKVPSTSAFRFNLWTLAPQMSWCC